MPFFMKIVSIFQLIDAHKSDAIHVEGLGSFDWMVVDAGVFFLQFIYSLLSQILLQETFYQDIWKKMLLFIAEMILGAELDIFRTPTNNKCIGLLVEKFEFF